MPCEGVAFGKPHDTERVLSRGRLPSLPALRLDTGGRYVADVRTRTYAFVNIWTILPRVPGPAAFRPARRAIWPTRHPNERPAIRAVPSRATLGNWGWSFHNVVHAPPPPVHSLIAAWRAHAGACMVAVTIAVNMAVLPLCLRWAARCRSERASATFGSNPRKVMNRAAGPSLQRDDR